MQSLAQPGEVRFGKNYYNKGMPELAELKLFADYVNVSVKNKVFNALRKTSSFKQPNLVSPFPTYVITAESRGKELKLTLSDSESVKTLIFGFGMTGHFVFTKTGKEEKFSHLMFDTDDRYTLSFVDQRRFGRWKWGTWKVERGPDPTVEYKAFVDKIYKNINKKAFDKPIYELLMNQVYCNGIGNYLRAEILGRIDSSPFISARDYIIKNPNVLELCNQVPLSYYHYKKKNELAYDDNEPYLIYCKKETSLSIKDKSNRTFWYDAKWGKTSSG